MAYEILTVAAGGTVAEIAPARGALVTRFALQDQEVFYLDRATFEDATRNVRGGAPILFPMAGRLAGDRFTAVPPGAAPTVMKQHGFGRNLAWSVAGRDAERVTLTLEADAVTRAQYPYEFRASYTVTVAPGTLTLELVVDNPGAVPLPAAPGWHPYFNCPAARKGELISDVPGFDPTLVGDAREFDFGLPRPPGAVRFTIPDLGTVALDASDNLRHLQLWSLPGKPFVCLEPFFAPAGAINGAARDEVPPGGSSRYAVAITVALSRR